MDNPWNCESNYYHDLGGLNECKTFMDKLDLKYQIPKPSPVN